MAALERASLTNTITGERVVVQFNPEEYTLQKEVQYAQATVPGLSTPLLQFAHGGLQSLDMELLLDAREAGVNDVRELVDSVVGLMAIDPTTHAPPVALFTWGSLTFKCVLASASQRFVLFRSDGVPSRARLQVSFQEYMTADEEARAVKRETADYTKVHTVRDGETLSSIAAATYGDAATWRPIAIRNRLADPSALVGGQSLVIPRLPYTDPDSGEITG